VLLETGAAKFAGSIPLILKLNTVNFLNEGKLDPTCAVTASVKDALRLGCTAVAFTLYPGSDRSDEMYEDFAEMAREAKSYGLPIIAMLTPKGGSLSKEASSSLDVLAYSTHLA
jgi:class I fructose-bisphosphate aldolase